MYLALMALKVVVVAMAVRERGERGPARVAEVVERRVRAWRVRERW